ncbi:substrate-binding periplasmic protein [Microbulbifer rhizosphaerae]|uniref:Polar amino acid transport system substrate-binding protein n=1 Tax=Microbulbifer rhizosphaerae TaxID=1562603 RepID=A0A7W4WAI0_9GAMM|nr:transporter substrate-binding domain-containing protein [Microbulbifer rhizosphaerae]MBB3060172.1 polar amino acid transport system substrate-binding protein [Microbulbifer rhizosphaerae]
MNQKHHSGGKRSAVDITKKLSFIIAFFILCLLSDKGFSENVVVGFGIDKPPFVIGSSKKGLEIDIFREALAYKGHTLEVVHLPNKRLQKALLTIQGIDAVATVRQVPGDGLYYVDDFVYFDNYAISRKKDNLKINKVSDLVGNSIVAWENAYRDLGATFEELFQPVPPKPYKKYYIEHSSQKGQNEMFWRGRSQIIIVDKAVFEWHRKQLGKKYDTTAEIVYHSIFSGKTYFQAAFKSKELAKDFEEGLKHIKRTSMYDHLYKKYTK